MPEEVVKLSKKLPFLPIRRIIAAWSLTQTLNIYQQALLGVRYFVRNALCFLCFFLIHFFAGFEVDQAQVSSCYFKIQLFRQMWLERKTVGISSRSARSPDTLDAS